MEDSEKKLARQKELHDRLKKLMSELGRKGLTADDEKNLFKQWRMLRNEFMCLEGIHMTVKQLIKELLEVDPNKEIMVFDVQDGWYADVQVVDQDNRVLMAVR